MVDQASYSKVRLHVIDPMCALYRPPTGVGDPEVALNQYVYHLARFDAEALARGWEDLVAGYKYVRWPSIAEIRSAVAEHQPATRSSGPAKADHFALSRDILKGQIGRAAAAGGYLSDLEQFVLKNGCAPSAAEESHMKAGIRESERLVADLRRQGGPAGALVGPKPVNLSSSLVRLWDKMGLYEAELCAAYHADLAPPPPVVPPKPAPPPEIMTAF